MRVLFVLPLLASLFAPATATTGTETLCLVPRGADVEKTVQVPDDSVPALLRTTRSYRGPCASYGSKVALGDGYLRTFTQWRDSVPLTMGVTFPSATLRGLPTEMNDGKICFDKDGDGSIERDTECAVGHARELDLRRAPGPFGWALVGWNPMGHIPVGVYNVPHFDFHFYLQPKAERDAIRPGPCPVLTNCDDYAKAKVAVPAKYVQGDFADVDAVEPKMGNHLIDLTAPEFHGVPFTYTWIYGSYEGKVTFYEAMITKAWFEGRKDVCSPLKLPAAWQVAGYYPTRYCVEYRDNRDDYTVTLTSFVRRAAG
ncbi:MAG: hypothetical protein HOY71_02655 [Nonomuraea sp.]|nr:hypothetical protein [Nonomuraea sp.]